MTDYRLSFDRCTFASFTFDVPQFHVRKVERFTFNELQVDNMKRGDIWMHAIAIADEIISPTDLMGHLSLSKVCRHLMKDREDVRSKGIAACSFIRRADDQ